MAKHKPLNIPVMQQGAKDYMTKYISTVPLFPGVRLEEDTFNKVMAGVTKAILAAWLDGYMSGRES